MGFLDFLDEHGKGILEFIDKHRTPEKSLEEYIMERTADQLYRAGVDCISPYLRGEPTIDDFYVTYGVTYSLKMSVSVALDRSYFVDRKLNQKPIPNAYGHKNVNAIDLLEKATDKGHADAPFVLAVLYEHGLTSGDVIDRIGYDGTRYGVRMPRLTYPNTLIFRDQKKADSYHYIAKDRESKFEEAYNYIKENCKVREGFKVDDGENIVMQMTQDKEVEKMLGSRANEFKVIGGKMVMYYAMMETPFSMGLASNMLSLMYRGESIECLEEFQYYPDEEKLQSANALHKRLMQMARSGDEVAIFSLNYWWRK